MYQSIHKPKVNAFRASDVVNNIDKLYGQFWVQNYLKLRSNITMDKISTLYV